ncbi:hypothetical protein DPMN_038706 [Dreissena polymorpha]|uniref:Uncharacterized protein n=1 Tax=Dreissena polymorpha TaxID=45954 RepID=A0A9D4MFY4_DREPO|nr:hypothetical protein DPMN_038706 [Dreissena polymorpha]
MATSVKGNVTPVWREPSVNRLTDGVMMNACRDITAPFADRAVPRVSRARSRPVYVQRAPAGNTESCASTTAVAHACR